jgi:hypothetical protein
MNFWPFVPLKPVNHLAVDVFAGTGSSRIGNALYGYRRMDRIKVPVIITSKIEIDEYKNVPKRNKFIVSRDGNGKDREKGEEMVSLRGHEIKSFIADILEEHDLKTIFGFCTGAGGTSSKLIPWLLPELKSDGYVDNATIFAIMPNIGEGHELLLNAMNFLEEMALLLDNKKIDSLVLIENGRTVSNDSSDYSKTNLAIARCLEIIGKSLLPDSNGRMALDPSDAKKLIFSKSNMLTMGYANLKMNRRHNDSLITGYISDLTRRVITNNWAGTEIESNCKRAYFVLRADPRYLSSNNLEIMAKVAKELLHSASVTVSDYAVPRSNIIEVVGIFVGIQTDIWSRYKQLVPDDLTPETEENFSARIALGIEEKHEEAEHEN